jgi:hypothetical protein
MISLLVPMNTLVIYIYISFTPSGSCMFRLVAGSSHPNSLKFSGIKWALQCYAYECTDLTLYVVNFNIYTIVNFNIICAFSYA